MNDSSENTIYKSLVKYLIEVETEYPDLVTGMITREKIREALLNGLTTKQIENFLNDHAHDLMQVYAKTHQ